MKEDFFDFLNVPSEENFQKSQQYVMNHKDYNPYSSELDQIIGFLDAKEYKKATDFKGINTILSPSSHLMKQFAYKELGDDKGANAEQFLFTSIMENLILTGEGSDSKPYIVTQISDERDMLEFLDEKFESQLLLKQETRTVDVIKTASGKSIYFDITTCYKALQSSLSQSDLENKLDLKEEPKEQLVEESVEEPLIEEKPISKNKPEPLKKEMQPEKKKWWKRK